MRSPHATATPGYPPPVPGVSDPDQVDTVLLQTIPEPEANAAARKLHQLFAHGGRPWQVLSEEDRRWWMRSAALILAAARGASGLQ